MYITLLLSIKLARHIIKVVGNRLGQRLVLPRSLITHQKLGDHALFGEASIQHPMLINDRVMVPVLQPDASVHHDSKLPQSVVHVSGSSFVVTLP